MKNVLFCGVDVDDQAFHFSLANPLSNEIRGFSCKPNASSLIRALRAHLPKGSKVRICYEAGYLGYSLCRQLRAAGFDCEIIAPSLIPQQPGKKQKTDRIDSQKLAEYYMKDLLTTIYVPSES